MREIVDKHFPDMFVVTWFLGYTVDISVVWSQYKAASMAISNTISYQSVKEETEKHLKNLSSSIEEVQGYLTEVKLNLI
jgi:WASH complex subunit strumpellin